MRLFVVLFVLVGAAFAMSHAAASQPPIAVAADGFPYGHESPEGAVADLGRAFLHKDEKASNTVCIRPYGGASV